MKKLFFILLFFFTANLLAQLNIIESISVTRNEIKIKPHYQFKKDYLTANFFVTYEDDTIDLTQLDESIITIPFILSVISMIWQSGKEWHIKTIDEDLYGSLKKIKHIYTLFYPQEQWHGELVPERIVKNNLIHQSITNAVLFSGGVDALCASLSHLDEPQILITIGGNDVPINDTTMWQEVKNQAVEFAHIYNHKNAFICSNFTKFLKHDNYKFSQDMRRYWWARTLQAGSYTGLTAPLCYWYGHANIYIGSTYTIDHPLPMGTHPLVDNNISFCGIQVHHDGAELSRQQKVEYIKNNSDLRNKPLPKLRVCWGKDKLGGNCCKCEKCLRTINNIIASLNKPQDFGFDCTIQQAIQTTKQFIAKKPDFRVGRVSDWTLIQHRILEQLHNTELLSNELQNYFFWFSSLDLQSLCKNKILQNQNKIKWYKTLWNLGMQGTTSRDLLFSLEAYNDKN